jgi:signal transduction histidine kinase
MTFRRSLRFSRGLRFRVAASFAALGGGLSLVIAIGLYVGAQDAGVGLIDETLIAEMQDYQARRARNPHSLPPATRTLHGYVTPAGTGEPALPVILAGLGPGRHHLNMDGIPYRLAVADRAGQRIYLLYNQALFVQQQHRLGFYLAVFVAFMAVASAGIALWLAERVIEPVKELARRVRDIGPDTPPAHLSADFPADEVGELARAFEQSLHRLAAFIARERAFTADVSHELRTPLAVIRGAAEVLLANEERPEKERLRLERIERAAADMADLTTALLAMARERDEGRGSPVDLSALLMETLDKHRHLLGDKPVDVVLEIYDRPSLNVDPNLLAIVVANLVRNSFHHTDRGTVRVRLHADRLSVGDTGLGIPREALNKVFQRLYRGQHSLGAGIGLSLARKICERYGWRINLESEEGRGTLVCLEFFPGRASLPLPE